MIEYIPPTDRDRMAESLGRAAAVASLSEYESHPLALIEALRLGVPGIGLNVAGISNLVQDGLVTGVSSDASPVVIAQALISGLKTRPLTVSPGLTTWDSAAANLAQVYLKAAGATPVSPPPRNR
jgi:glycosyltransferase involved in cell wall biosynthesis